MQIKFLRPELAKPVPPAPFARLSPLAQQAPRLLTTNVPHQATPDIPMDMYQGLNEQQISAIEAIGEIVSAEDGLLDALRGWRSHPEFRTMHREALVALITNEHRPVSPEIAVTMLQGLSPFQADAVFKIVEKIGAVDGLGDALRGWRSRPEFKLGHRDALVALITNEHRRVSPQIAVAMLQGLSHSQALAVRYIVEKIGAVDGLGDALRGWRSPPEFTLKHRDALVAFITNEHRRVSPEIAVTMLQGLSDSQAKSFGAIVEKIGAVDALGDALRSWRIPPEFRSAHGNAVFRLTTNADVTRRLTAAQAIAEIQGMDANQALRVFNGESREQIFESSEWFAMPATNTSVTNEGFFREARSETSDTEEQDDLHPSKRNRLDG